MKRKIIKQGHNTLTLTIPTKWARKYDLKAGDEIDLEEQDNSILINTNKSKAIKSISINVSKLTTLVLWRKLISAYRAGYDEITVTFNNDSSKGKNVYTGFGFNTMNLLLTEGTVSLNQIETIQALVNRLIGVEIIDQKETRCIIKEMGETTYKEFDNSLRRIFLLLLSMAEECYDGYNNNNKAPLKNIHMIDTNLDRFEDFCIRVLNKIGYKDHKKTSTMHSIIFLLELVGDEYKKMALHFLNSTHKPHKRMIKEFKIQHAQVRRLYELFYAYDDEKAMEIYREDTQGDKFLNDNFSEFNDEEKEVIHHFKKIGVYVLSLVELRMDLEA